jgi:hypothetical protein
VSEKSIFGSGELDQGLDHSLGEPSEADQGYHGPEANPSPSEDLRVTTSHGSNDEGWWSGLENPDEELGEEFTVGDPNDAFEY